MYTRVETRVLSCPREPDWFLIVEHSQKHLGEVLCRDSEVAMGRDRGEEQEDEREDVQDRRTSDGRQDRQGNGYDARCTEKSGGIRYDHRARTGSHSPDGGSARPIR